MKQKNYKALKVANVLINIAISVTILSTLTALLVSVTHFDLASLFGKNYYLEMNFDTNQLYSPFFLILLIADSALWITLLQLVKFFFKNIIANHIFTQDNIKLSHAVSYVFIALAFLDTWFANLSSASNNFILVNQAYLIAAFVVWVFSLILKEANAIAEENEFTI